MVRKVSIFFLTAIFAWFYNGSAYASETGIDANPHWSDCRQDSDCVEVSMPCGRGAVNKKYFDDAHGYYVNHAFEALECAARDTSTGGHPICDRYVACNDGVGTCAVDVGTCKILAPHKP